VSEDDEEHLKGRRLSNRQDFIDEIEFLRKVKKVRAQGGTSLSKTKRNYKLVPPHLKKELIEKVRKGFTIKEASALLNINYSTAKHIVKLARGSQVMLSSGEEAFLNSYANLQQPLSMRVPSTSSTLATPSMPT
jgi:hypothetical protein